MSRLPIALTIVLAALLTTPAAAREYRYGDVVVRVLPDLPQSTTHGYHEFPFQVINESASSRRVTLAGPAQIQAGVGTHSLRSIERSVTVGPRSEVRLALLQPPLPVFGSGLRVTIDGRRQGEVIPWSSGHPEYWVGGGGRYSSGTAHRSCRVLIGQSVSEQDFPPHRPEEYWVFRAVMPVDLWSGDWLAYSGYDGVVMSAEELAGAPPAVVEALWGYVETGGSLLALGRPQPESAWGRAYRLRPQAALYEAGLEVAYAGFGVVLVAEGAARVSDFTEPQRGHLEKSWYHGRRIWDRTRDPSAAHRAFAVTDNVEIPVRGLFVVVLAFTVLIGPVNLAVLTRRKRRMWLLWTVPAASVLTCALVVLYVFAGEGWVRYGRTEGLTVLDQRTRRATTLGWTGFYATMTPGDGLGFGTGTEVSPIVSWDRDRRDGGGRAVIWSDRQQLRRGWLRARLPSYFVVRKSELRRERISLRRRAGSPPGGGQNKHHLEAVNGLGVDLESLHLADSGGRLYAARDLAAGAAAGLEPVGKLARAGPGVLRDGFRGDLPSRLWRMEQEPDRYLRPGTWLAVARANPFIETGLGDLDRTAEKAVIYGIYEDDPEQSPGPGGGGT